MKNTIQLPKKGKTLHSQPDSTFNGRMPKADGVDSASKTGTALALQVWPCELAGFAWLRAGNTRLVTRFGPWDAV